MTNRPTIVPQYTAVTAAHHQWITSFRQGNMTGIAVLYTTTGQMLPAYSPAILGRAAIQAFWQGCWDMGIGTVERTPTEVECLRDTINEVGAYRILDRHGRVVDVGKYVVIWKQGQGEWQIHRDIWTSNLPSNLPLLSS